MTALQTVCLCVQLPLTTDDKREQKQEVSFAPEPPTVEGGGGKQESDVRYKIPEGAEATTVLVGTLDELEQPVLVFVRLAKGCPLNITEVSIPVRFLFVLLGPSSGEESYYEIGRSVATLMSDQASTLLSDIGKLWPTLFGHATGRVKVGNCGMLIMTAMTGKKW